MELPVEFTPAQQIRFLVNFGENGVRLLQNVLAEMGNRQAQGQCLQSETDFTNFLDLFWSEGRDNYSAMGIGKHKAFYLQLAQSFPDRKPADTELGC